MVDNDSLIQSHHHTFHEQDDQPNKGLSDKENSQHAH